MSWNVNNYILNSSTSDNSFNDHFECGYINDDSRFKIDLEFHMPGRKRPGIPQRGVVWVYESYLDPHDDDAEYNITGDVSETNYRGHYYLFNNIRDCIISYNNIVEAYSNDDFSNDSFFYQYFEKETEYDVLTEYSIDEKIRIMSDEFEEYNKGMILTLHEAGKRNELTLLAGLYKIIIQTNGKKTIKIMAGWDENEELLFEE